MWRYDYDQSGWTDGKRFIHLDEYEHDEFTEPQGSVMAESLNTLEQTGLTPAQLQARVAELEKLIADAREDLHGLWKAGDIARGVDSLDALGVYDA